MADQPKLKTSSSAGFQNMLARYSDWLLGIGVLGLLVTLVTPMPPVVLDLFLAMNMTTGVVLLMVTLNAKRSAELSTFPTILLFATLFRLGLNVASTRLILTGGDAGHVISAFGEYVGGDNLGVGLVVFLILIIIQFVVITKGSGRISEVAARFVLDAMPGKQMAIDADLNGGLIDSDTARRRREEIASEAEFYGAMDGASKFVRGDAIAGLIITALNLVGGITIGTLGGRSLGEAADTYSKLTIGDGLVSQIPALLISTAAGVLVTKETSKDSLGYALMGQVTGRPRAMLIAAGTMFAVGWLPGMPRLPFFVLATVLLILWNAAKTNEAEEQQAVHAAQVAEAEAAEETSEEDEVGELLKIDRVCLEIGYRLIALVQDKNGGGILDHIAQLRRRFALKDGLVLPPVRIKDNIKLAPKAYRLMIGGEEVAGGEIEPGEFLAMDSGGAGGDVKGRETIDPAFGLPAKWIAEAHRDEAEIMGYTVIDPTSVLVTHLSEVLRGELANLLSRDDIKELIDNVKTTSPAIVEELVPEKMSYGEVQRVLRNLLREEVSVRNMPAILEVLADNVAQTRDIEALTELVRQRLGRSICEAHSDPSGVVYAVTLDPGVESRLAAAVGAADTDQKAVSPAWLHALVERVGATVGQTTQSGRDVVLLVRSNVRRFLGELVRTGLPKVAVLSYNEVVPARAVETIAVVKMED
ncbi:MAG: flagellar biosynthesis protein FlhA [bacterium]|nr:flagellar biosynthesis protein FlhA [bacterium]